METLLYLLPISLVLVSIAISIFIWGVNNGQFEDLERSAIQALEDAEHSDTEERTSHE